MEHPTTDALLLDSLSEGGADVGVHAHIESCAACSKARDEVRRVFDALGAAADPQAPASGARERLLAATLSTPRLGRFAPLVAGLCALTREEALAELSRVDEADAWRAEREQGVSSIPLAIDARHGTAMFLRLERGHTLPSHAHAAVEISLCLQGRIRSSDGAERGPGELLVANPGSRHSLQALPGPAVIALVVVKPTNPL